MKTKRMSLIGGRVSGIFAAGLARVLSAVALFAAVTLAGCAKHSAEQPAAGADDGAVAVSFAVPVIASKVDAEPLLQVGRSAPASIPTLSVGCPTALGASPVTRAVLGEKTTVRVVVFNAASDNPAQSNYQTDFSYCMSAGRLVPCSVNSDGSFKAFAHDNLLMLLPGTYDFYAITPALPLSSDKIKVTVPNGVDYASSVTPSVKISASQSVNLADLDRRCAKIAFSVVPGNDDILKISWAPQNGTTISALPPAQEVTIGNGDIIAGTGSTTYTVPPSAFVQSSVKTVNAEFFLLPRIGVDRMVVSCPLLITTNPRGVVTTDEVTVVGSVSNLDLKSKFSHPLIMTVKYAAGLTYPYVSEGKMIVLKDEFGQATDGYRGYDWSNQAPTHNELSSDNAPFEKFEVAASDIGGGIPWNEAYNSSCPSGWRLPVLKELELMHALQSKLTAVSGFSFNDDYWTCTDFSEDNNFVWRVVFNSDFYADPRGSKNPNEYQARVRCVRDVYTF